MFTAGWAAPRRRSACRIADVLALKSQLDENGTCEYVNAAGDKFFGAYARKGDPAKAEGTWHYVHGTGKFAGISGEGKWLPIGVFPPTGMPDMTTACNHEWGTYNIK